MATTPRPPFPVRSAPAPRLERSRAWKHLGAGLFSALLAITAIAASSSCDTQGQDAGALSGLAPRTAVLATVTMLADSAAALLGGAAEVTPLIGPGVDPHLFRATRDDMQRLLQADLVLSVGLHLEANLEESLDRLNAGSGPQARLLTLGTSAPAERLLHTPIGAHGRLSSVDPHLWMDVDLWSAALLPLSERLAQRFPADAGAIARQSASYRAELAHLDRYIAERIATIPEAQRWLVTAHDAFRYFGRRYGLEVRGLQGLSTESEAGLLELAELVELLVERRIPVVFVESSVPQQGVRALIAGAEQRGHGVRLGGTLFSDATGPAGSFEGTLIGMLVHNAETIALGLGGQVPPGGYRAWRLALAQAQPEPRSMPDSVSAAAESPAEPKDQQAP